MLCKQHPNEYVTTMFDYYAMPSDTPNISDDTLDIYQRIENIENAVDNDISMPNCHINLVIHEFEGLLFSNPRSFSKITDDFIVESIQQIRDEVSTPEHINNSYETAPSRRIKELIPNYSKIRNGVLLAKDMGIDVIMKECKHFAEWIEKIKTL